MIRAGFGRAICHARRLSTIEIRALRHQPATPLLLDNHTLWKRKASTATQEASLAEGKERPLLDADIAQKIDVKADRDVTAEQAVPEEDWQQDNIALSLAETGAEKKVAAEGGKVIDDLLEDCAKDLKVATQRYLHLEESNRTADWTSVQYSHLINRVGNIPSQDLPTTVFDKVRQITRSRSIKLDEKAHLQMVRVYTAADIRRAQRYLAMESELEVERARITGEAPKSVQNRIQRLQKRMEACSSQAHADAAEELMQQAFDEGYRPRPSDYAAMLHMHGTRRNVASVEKWVQLLSERDVEIKLPIYVAVITAYGYLGDAYNAQKWFEKYVSTHGRRAEVYKAFIEALGRVGRAPLARDILERVMPEQKVQPTIDTYTAVSKVLGSSGDFVGAIEILGRMRADSVLAKGIEDAYSVILEQAILKGDYAVASDMFAHLKERRLPNFTYSQYGRLCIEQNHLDEALAVYRKIYSRSGMADPMFSGDLANSLIKAGRKSDAFRLLEIVHSASAKRKASSPGGDGNVFRLVPILMDAAKGDLKMLLRLQEIAESQGYYGSESKSPCGALLAAYQQKKDSVDLSIEDYRILYLSLFSSRKATSKDDLQKASFAFLKDMELKGLKPTEALSDLVISGFKGRYMVGAEIEWKKAMAKLDVKTPEISSEYASFITREEQQSLCRKIVSCCSSGNVAEALQIMEKLQKVNLFPDPFTVSRLILTLGSRGEFETVTQVFTKALERARTLRNLKVREHWEDSAFEAVIIAYTRAGYVSAAAKFFIESVTVLGRHPFAQKTYVWFFDTVGRSRGIANEDYADIYAVFEAYRDLVGAKTISLAVYNAVLRIMRKAGRYEHVVELARLMQEAEITLDPPTYQNLILSLIRSQRIDEAAKLFEKYLDEYWERMDITVFNVMISGYLAHDDFADALRVLKIAESADLRANVETYELLITGLARSEEYAGSALSLVHKMKESGLPVRPQVYESVILGTCSGKTKSLSVALQCYRAMEQANMRPSPNVFEKLIVAMIDQGDMVTAEKLRLSMDTIGRHPTSETEAALQAGYLKRGDLLSARRVFDGMANPVSETSIPHPTRTKESYQMIINAAIKAGRTDLAAEYVAQAKGSPYEAESPGWAESLALGA
ncbi:pentatricopeptide repeat domain-containing protein [Spizellomyces punctatus DAOM BR117]|uniref:Pentatricopeptide repeat domain-containing protein n=1 Tax=Spizellomyces punctatus (strain DAOM BR117) TaxID=645134 RepID=A0A0L0H9S6_SPIPD|nr:pentatricopeptide repeat domain-containing protein [Spizellomyces punctatus DAOM BR117]KNC97766.1 pentatricopeptide repeat domain-containing protein [Spizellomyces punctatus DAOM BR117]|eukprot:XP_016605806.1 pentatricopeptide repeat domain-containing protein [Spizellomyces punctatus DAOM BR117]